MLTRGFNIVFIGNKLADFGYTLTNIDTLGPRLKQLGYNIIYAGDKPDRSSRLWQMISTIIKNRKYTDIVLIDTYSTSAFYFAYANAVICRLCGIKYIPILHGGNLPVRFLRSPTLCRTVFKYSYANIAVSKYLAQTLADNNYSHQVIENSINILDYPFLHRKNISPRLLWVRSFDKIYNPEMAVRVLYAVRKSYHGAKLTMVGPDKDGSLVKCKELAASLGVCDNVIFTGKLEKSEWIALAKSHDIFINTSSIDNTPVSVIEAMAMGMVVVSTNVGGIPFLLSDNNAVLVELGNANQMASAIIELLKDDNRTDLLSANARREAEKYDWNMIKGKWQTLFESIKND